MTPFGLYLEKIRRSRGLQQTQLADLLTVNSCYVSAIENGKKGPPSDNVLNKLRKAMELSASEELELRDAVDSSQRVIRIPDNATAKEYALFNEMKKHIGTMSDGEIELIRGILELRQDKQKQRIRGI